MTKLQYFLKGVGSIMDIAPRVDYSCFVPKKTPSERMEEHWKRTGQHISHAIDSFAYEQKKQK